MDKQGFWDEGLQDLQRQYWQRWSELNAAAMGQPAPKSPWEMAQEHWWQAIAPSAPASANDFMTRMMEQGSRFFRMAELFSAEGGGGQPAWTAVIDQLAEQMKSALTGADTATSDAQWQKLMGFWSAPTEGWRRLADSLAFDATGPLGQGAAAGNPFSPQRLLQMPGLGLNREEQAEQQKLAQLVAEHQRALHAYHRFFSDLGSEAVQRLREELQRVAASGRTIESGRALYDTWVAVCESVYGERVVGEAFARVNGDLINSAMRVKQQMSRMADDYLGRMNMPTRRELRTLQLRLQEHRRENRQLRGELARLGQRLEALENPPAASAQGGGRPAAGRRTPATARKAPRPKKTTVRKATVKKTAVRKHAVKKRVAKKERLG